MPPCWRVCGKNLNIVSMCVVSPVLHTLNICSCQKQNLFSFPVAVNNSIKVGLWFSCYICLYSRRTIWNALYNFSIRSDEGFPQQSKHLAIKIINVVVTDAWYFSHRRSLTEVFRVFLSSCRQMLRQDCDSSTAVPTNYFLSSNGQTFYIQATQRVLHCLHESHEYVCEIGGTDPLIPNLSNWWIWVVNYTIRQISPFGNSSRYTVRRRAQWASELDTLQKREHSRLSVPPSWTLCRRENILDWVCLRAGHSEEERTF